VIGGSCLQVGSIDLTDLPLSWLPPPPDFSNVGKASPPEKKQEVEDEKEEEGEPKPAAAAAAAKKASSSLQSQVAQAVKNAIIKSKEMGLEVPSMDDVSTVIGGLSLTPKQGLFVYCTSSGRDLSEVTEEKSSVVNIGTVNNETSVISMEDAGGSDSEQDAKAAMAGKATWRVRYGASTRIWMHTNTRKKLRSSAGGGGVFHFQLTPRGSVAALMVKPTPTPVQTAGKVQESLAELADNKKGKPTDKKGVASKGPTPRTTEDVLPSTDATPRVVPLNIQVPLFAMLVDNNEDSKSTHHEEIVSVSESKLTPYRCNFELFTRFELEGSPEMTSLAPPPPLDAAVTQALDMDSNRSINNDSVRDSESIRSTTSKKVPRGSAKVSLTLSAPLCVPSMPIPRPPTRARTPKARRNLNRFPSNSLQQVADQMNLPPLKRLAAHRRWPSAVLPSPLPNRFMRPPAAAAGADNGKAAAVAREIDLESTPSTINETSSSTNPVKKSLLEESSAWSHADPLVGLLIPARSLPKVQDGGNNDDELEREMRAFITSLADEIKNQVNVYV
jgi:hypothetical protein